MAEPAAESGSGSAVVPPGESTLAAPGERGTLTVADKVVERIAAIAAGEIEAVTDQASGWNRVIRRHLPRATAQVAGGRARVVVSVAASWPTPLTSMATDVRDHVNERVTTLTGVTVTAVDVTVADVIHPEGSTRRVQ